MGTQYSYSEHRNQQVQRIQNTVDKATVHKRELQVTKSDIKVQGKKHINAKCTNEAQHMEKELKVTTSGHTPFTENWGIHLKLIVTYI